MAEATDRTKIRPTVCILLRNQAGMTYLFVMMLVIFMSISLIGVTQQWSVIMQRDREAELVFRANRIVEAIERYVADYEVQKAVRPNRWPRSLQDLTKKSPKRYLQMAYADPLTGQKFELIKVGEELHGVKSSSTETPYNQKDFKGAKTYQEVRFEAKGLSSNCQINPLNPMAQTNCAPPGTPAPGMPAPGVPASGIPAPGTSAPGTPAPGMPAPETTPAPTPSESIPGS